MTKRPDRIDPRIAAEVVRLRRKAAREGVGDDFLADCVAAAARAHELRGRMTKAEAAAFVVAARKLLPLLPALPGTPKVSARERAKRHADFLRAEHSGDAARAKAADRRLVTCPAVSFKTYARDKMAGARLLKADGFFTQADVRRVDAKLAKLLAAFKRRTP